MRMEMERTSLVLLSCAVVATAYCTPKMAIVHGYGTVSAVAQHARVLAPSLAPKALRTP